MRHLFTTFHPRFTTARPMSVITDRRRRYTGVTTTGYAIIVTAAVATNRAKQELLISENGVLREFPALALRALSR
jgi:hypothetical protein